QVVRVIVIQKTLIEHAEKLRQVKTVFVEITFWNGAGRKFLRDIQEGSTEAAEVGWQKSLVDIIFCRFLIEFVFFIEKCTS
ncbi:hypothetical protein IGI04_037288, partial [Brassica rapa subsp. trilocularis]